MKLLGIVGGMLIISSKVDPCEFGEWGQKKIIANRKVSHKKGRGCNPQTPL